MSGPLYVALRRLTADELYVIVSIYWGGLTESAVAVELTDGRSTSISRDWVHRRHLTALAKMRRELNGFIEWYAA